MSNLLLLQTWTLYVFPNKSYKVLKWQIWKCELGWFSLRWSHIYIYSSMSLLKKTYSYLQSWLFAEHMYVINIASAPHNFIVCT